MTSSLSSKDEHLCIASSAVSRASASGAKEIATALWQLVTKEDERLQEGGKETVAEVFGEEKGGKALHLMGHGAHIKGLGDTTVKDLENWLR